MCLFYQREGQGEEMKTGVEDEEDIREDDVANNDASPPDADTSTTEPRDIVLNKHIIRSVADKVCNYMNILYSFLNPGQKFPYNLCRWGGEKFPHKLTTLNLINITP